MIKTNILYSCHLITTTKVSLNMYPILLTGRLPDSMPFLFPLHATLLGEGDGQNARWRAMYMSRQFDTIGCASNTMVGADSRMICLLIPQQRSCSASGLAASPSSSSVSSLHGGGRHDFGTTGFRRRLGIRGQGKRFGSRPSGSGPEVTGGRQCRAGSCRQTTVHL